MIAEDSSVIRVYPGAAKYSGLIRDEGNIEMKVGLLSSGYKPTVNTSKVDLTKVKATTATSTGVYDSTNEVYGITQYNLSIPANTRYEGYVVYEEASGDLIYAVIEDIAPDVARTITSETV